MNFDFIRNTATFYFWRYFT